MELRDIPYKVSYRNIRYPRLEFTTGELLFVLPFSYKPDSLLDKYRGWILKKIEFVEGCLKKAPNKKLVERSEKEFRDLIHSFVERTSKELDVKLNKIYFRKMRTKWASLSHKKNLTMNRMMKSLPEHLIKYIIFHEITHAIERRHNDRFWGIISGRFVDYRSLERDLFIYWFRVIDELKIKNGLTKD